MTSKAESAPTDKGAKHGVSTNDCPGAIFRTIGFALNVECDEVMLFIFNMSIPRFFILRVLSLN
jgi:hypothetical protein